MSAATLRLVSAALVASSLVQLASAATAQIFEPPSKGPLVQTANYTSFSNTTLRDKNDVKGKVFNRIIQVWLENTDFEVRLLYALEFWVQNGLNFVYLILDGSVHANLRVAH